VLILNGIKGIATTAGETQHSYEYKIVFFAKNVTPIYYYKMIEVKIEVEAKLYNYSTEGNWRDSDSDYFKIESGSEIKYINDGLILLYDGQNTTGKGNDAGTTIWKDLVGSNDGILLNSPSWENNCLRFDGINDKVQFVGNIPPIYTITTTFYADTSSTVNYQRVFSSPISTAVQTTTFPSLCIDSTTPRILRLFGQGVDNTFAKSYFTEIIQATMTFDGTNVSIYINGEFVSQLATTNIPDSIPIAYLGGRADNNRQFKGSIYNFMIYDRVLTSTEINTNYEIYVDTRLVPITTVDNFKKIGSNEIIEIDGKYYSFDVDAIYEVKNDLVFSNDGRWYPNISSMGRINTYDKVITINDINGSDVYYYQNQVYVTADNAIVDGLQLHYDSINNTGTGVRDTSAPTWSDLAGTNNGTLAGGVTWGGTDGIVFDGKVGSHVSFVGNITNRYTVLITAKPELTGTHPRLVSSPGRAGSTFPIVCFNSGSEYKIAFTGQGKDAVVSPGIIPPEDSPSYIIITYDGAEVRLYFNGEYIGKISSVTTNPVSIATAYLGGNAASGSDSRGYKGEMYDFMIYDRVLTDFEIERSNITNEWKYRK